MADGKAMLMGLADVCILITVVSCYTFCVHLVDNHKGERNLHILGRQCNKSDRLLLHFQGLESIPSEPPNCVLSNLSQI
jgi:hypothetical protein